MCKYLALTKVKFTLGPWSKDKTWNDTRKIQHMRGKIKKKKEKDPDMRQMIELVDKKQ